MLENAFLSLLTRYLENLWTKLSAFMHFGTKMNASIFGSKGQRSRSQHDKSREAGLRHTEQDFVSSSNF